MYSETRGLRRGKHRLLLWPGREADGSNETSTPSKVAQRDEMGRLEKVCKLRLPFTIPHNTLHSWLKSTAVPSPANMATDGYVASALRLCLGQKIINSVRKSRHFGTRTIRSTSGTALGFRRTVGNRLQSHAKACPVLQKKALSGLQQKTIRM